MRIAIFAVLCAVTAGEARADQFDLVCNGQYIATDLTPEALSRAANGETGEERQFRISMDTHAALARATSADLEWGRVAKLDESPTRYQFTDNRGRWTFDRQSGRGSFTASTSSMFIVYTGTCERAEYTPIPERKF